VAGAGLAVAAFFVLSYLRAGRWPELSGALAFHQEVGSRAPQAPIRGLHWVILVTCLAAVASGFVRTLSAERLSDRARVHAGAMLFAGTFGSGVLGYYAGEGYVEALLCVFPLWSLSLLLLLIPLLPRVFPGLAPGELAGPRLPRRLEALPATGLFLGLCALLTTVSSFPSIGREARRLAARPETAAAQLAFVSPTKVLDGMSAMIGKHAQKGEKILCLAAFGHWGALRAGTENVSPLPSLFAMRAGEGLKWALAALDREEGRKVILSGRPFAGKEKLVAELKSRRYAAVDQDEQFEVWASAGALATSSR
jgi:hypothetical protein